MAMDSTTAALKETITRQMVLDPLVHPQEILSLAGTIIQRCARIRVAEHGPRGAIISENFGARYPGEGENVVVPPDDQTWYDIVFDIAIVAVGGPSGGPLNKLHAEASSAPQPLDGLAALLAGLRRHEGIKESPSLALADQVANFSFNVLDPAQLSKDISRGRRLMTVARELNVPYTEEQWVNMIIKGVGGAQHHVFDTFKSTKALSNEEVTAEALFEALSRTMTKSTAPWVVPALFGRGGSAGGNTGGKGGGDSGGAKGGGKNSQGPCYKMIVNGTCTRKDCPFRHTGDMAAECPQWMKLGKCNYGDVCKFVHTPSKRGSGGSKSGGGGSSSSSTTKVADKAKKCWKCPGEVVDCQLCTKATATTGGNAFKAHCVDPTHCPVELLKALNVGNAFLGNVSTKWLLDSGAQTCVTSRMGPELGEIMPCNIQVLGISGETVPATSRAKLGNGVDVVMIPRAPQNLMSLAALLQAGYKLEWHHNSMVQRAVFSREGSPDLVFVPDQDQMYHLAPSCMSHLYSDHSNPQLTRTSHVPFNPELSQHMGEVRVFSVGGGGGKVVEVDVDKNDVHRNNNDDITDLRGRFRHVVVLHEHSGHSVSYDHLCKVVESKPVLSSDMAKTLQEACVTCALVHAKMPPSRKSVDRIRPTEVGWTLQGDLVVYTIQPDKGLRQHLFVVDEVSSYLDLHALPNKTASVVAQHVTGIVRGYEKDGHIVRNFRGDDEAALMALKPCLDMLGLNVSSSRAGASNKIVEREVRRCNEMGTSILVDFQRLTGVGYPTKHVEDAIQTAVDVYNHTPLVKELEAAGVAAQTPAQQRFKHAPTWPDSEMAKYPLGTLVVSCNPQHPSSGALIPRGDLQIVMRQDRMARRVKVLVVRSGQMVIRSLTELRILDWNSLTQEEKATCRGVLEGTGISNFNFGFAPGFLKQPVQAVGVVAGELSDNVSGGDGHDNAPDTNVASPSDNVSSSSTSSSSDTEDSSSATPTPSVSLPRQQRAGRNTISASILNARGHDSPIPGIDDDDGDGEDEPSDSSQSTYIALLRHEHLVEMSNTVEDDKKIRVFMAISRKEAKEEFGDDQVRDAMVAEGNNMAENNIFAPVKRADLPGHMRGKRAIRSSYVWSKKKKEDGSMFVKMRLVANQYRNSTAHTKADLHSPTGRKSSLRVTLALAAATGMELEQADVGTAFLKTRERDSEPELVRLSPEMADAMYLATENDDYNTNREPDGSVLVLVSGAMYGLVHSPRRWNEDIRKTLVDGGWEMCPFDECWWVRWSDKSSRPRFPSSHADNMDQTAYQAALVDVCANIESIVCLHVDDTFSLRRKGQQSPLLELLQRTYGDVKIKMGPVFQYCGCSITDTPEAIILDQKVELAEILANFASWVPSREYHTPLSADYGRLTDAERGAPASAEDAAIYHSLIPSLNFIATTSSPVLATAVSFLSRVLKNPLASDIDEAKRVLGFVKTHPECASLVFPRGWRDDSFRVVAFSDSSFAPRGDRSQTGGAVMVGPAVVQWISRRSPRVALSTEDAEVQACIAVSKEALAIQGMMKWLLSDGLVPEMLVCQDSSGALRSAQENPQSIGVEGSGSIYRVVSKAFVHDLFLTREARFVYIPGVDLVADVMTKALPRSPFARFASWLRDGCLLLSSLTGRLGAVSPRGCVARSILDRACECGIHRCGGRVEVEVEDEGV